MSNLETILDELQQAPHDSEVSFGDMLEATGHRSFGPALLVPGLILRSPLGGVPGMATGVGIVALLVAGQIVLGRGSLWMPQWLLRRRFPTERFRRALRAMRKPSAIIDRFVRPRLDWMLRKPALQVLSVSCVATGFLMPALEAVPFADTAPGAALTAFGLALVARDGALAVIAAILCGLSLALVGVAAL